MSNKAFFGGNIYVPHSLHGLEAIHRPLPRPSFPFCVHRDGSCKLTWYAIPCHWTVRFLPHMLSSCMLPWTRRPFTPFLLPLPCTVDDSIPLAPSDPPPLPLAPGGIGTISKVGFRNRSPSFAFDEEGGALPMASEAEGPSQEKEKVKKARTTYERLGQTRETPPEGDPLRRFYTSLYEENPESLMARKWCGDRDALRYQQKGWNTSRHEEPF